MKQNKMSNGEFAVLMSIGIAVIAVGTDATGRLFMFLCGEWPHVFVGILILSFVLVCLMAHFHYKDHQHYFVKEVEKKLTEYKYSLSYVTFEKCSMRDEIEFMRRSLESHWALCQKTIEAAEKALEPKPPVIIEHPSQPVQQIEQNVVEAVQEVLGGAL